MIKFGRIGFFHKIVLQFIILMLLPLSSLEVGAQESQLSDSNLVLKMTDELRNFTGHLERDWDNRNIARFFARMSEYNISFKYIDAIDTAMSRAYALRDLSDSIVNKQDNSNYSELLKKIIERAMQFNGSLHKGMVLSHLADEMAPLSDNFQADSLIELILENAYHIENPFHQATVLVSIAGAKAQRGHEDNAANLILEAIHSIQKLRSARDPEMESLENEPFGCMFAKYYYFEELFDRMAEITLQFNDEQISDSVFIAIVASLDKIYTPFTGSGRANFGERTYPPLFAMEDTARANSMISFLTLELMANANSSFEWNLLDDIINSIWSRGGDFEVEKLFDRALLSADDSTLPSFKRVNLIQSTCHLVFALNKFRQIDTVLQSCIELSQNLDSAYHRSIALYSIWATLRSNENLESGATVLEMAASNAANIIDPERRATQSAEVARSCMKVTEYVRAVELMALAIKSAGSMENPNDINSYYAMQYVESNILKLIWRFKDPELSYTVFNRVIDASEYADHFYNQTSVLESITRNALQINDPVKSDSILVSTLEKAIKCDEVREESESDAVYSVGMILLRINDGQRRQSIIKKASSGEQGAEILYSSPSLIYAEALAAYASSNSRVGDSLIVASLHALQEAGGIYNGDEYNLLEIIAEFVFGSYQPKNSSALQNFILEESVRFDNGGWIYTIIREILKAQESNISGDYYDSLMTLVIEISNTLKEPGQRAQILISLLDLDDAIRYSSFYAILEHSLQSAISIDSTFWVGDIYEDIIGVVMDIDSSDKRMSYIDLVIQSTNNIENSDARIKALFKVIEYLEYDIDDDTEKLAINKLIVKACKEINPSGYKASLISRCADFYIESGEIARAKELLDLAAESIRYEEDDWYKGMITSGLSGLAGKLGNIRLGYEVANFNDSSIYRIPCIHSALMGYSDYKTSHDQQ